MTRNPFEGFLRQLLWFLSGEDGLSETWRIRELYEVKRTRQRIRRLSKDEARFDFIMLDILNQLDDIEGRIYIARPDMR